MFPSLNTAASRPRSRSSAFTRGAWWNLRHEATPQSWQRASCRLGGAEEVVPVASSVGKRQTWMQEGPGARSNAGGVSRAAVGGRGGAGVGAKALSCLAERRRYWLPVVVGVSILGGGIEYSNMGIGNM